MTLRTDTNTLPIQAHKSMKNEALSLRLQQRLFSYAVAGAAIGAFPPQAQGEIIYTPVHSRIDSSFYLDLNHDGVNDFQVSSSYLSGVAKVNVVPVISGNKIAATPEGCFLRIPGAAPLNGGTVIGKELFFRSDANCVLRFNSGYYGPWVGVQEGFLGVSFLISGERHFGWIRMRIHDASCFGCVAGIKGYAYETIPGKPIKAGDTGFAIRGELEPATPGILALGTLGLQRWRRED
jgi:hypothetical protein